ncbi:hypothetical protein G3D64_004221 [Salmonella enterica subsp. enterica serovar Cerro]|nr:hypothetical protein [Salmonella enterica]EEI3401076.1 hypothetical protein [Salmonella enterica subsp. enterica serovar Cerro]
MKLFVSYSWSDSTANGFGNVAITSTAEETSMGLIQDVAEEIKKHMDRETKIIILNFVRLAA